MEGVRYRLSAKNFHLVYAKNDLNKEIVYQILKENSKTPITYLLVAELESQILVLISFQSKLQVTIKNFLIFM